MGSPTEADGKTGGSRTGCARVSSWIYEPVASATVERVGTAFAALPTAAVMLTTVAETFAELVNDPKRPNEAGDGDGCDECDRYQYDRSEHWRDGFPFVLAVPYFHCVSRQLQLI